VPSKKNYFFRFAGYCAIAVLGNFIASRLFNIPSQTELVVFTGILLFVPILLYPVLGAHILFLLLPFIPLVRKLYYLMFERPDKDPLLMLGDLIIVVILIGLFFDFREKKERSVIVTRHIAAVLIYFIYLGIRVVVANELSLPAAIARYKFYGPAVLLFFIGVMFAGRLKHLKGIWVTTVVAGTLAALYGLKQLYFGFSRAEELWYASVNFSSLFINNVARPFSFFQSPAAFADYMQIALIGILVLGGMAKGRLALLMPVPWILYMYGMLITSVRSSWIGFFVFVFFWFLFLRIRSMGRRLAVSIAVMILFVLINSFAEQGAMMGSAIGFAASKMPATENLDNLVTERVTAVEDPFAEHSFQSRLAFWGFIITSSANPIQAILGRGTGAMSADSLYFTYLAEFGYPGVLFIVTLILSFIINGLKVVDKSTNRDVVLIAKGIVVFNITFAILGISGTHIHAFPGDAYFWFWNGVMIKFAAFDLPFNPMKSAPDETAAYF
jgi:hypothetical protein